MPHRIRFAALFAALVLSLAACQTTPEEPVEAKQTTPATRTTRTGSITYGTEPASEKRGSKAPAS